MVHVDQLERALAGGVIGLVSVAEEFFLLARVRGFRAMSRIHLLLGAFAYLASPAWLLFVILGLIELADLCPSHA